MNRKEVEVVVRIVDLESEKQGVNIVHDLIHISPLYIASCGSV